MKALSLIAVSIAIMLTWAVNLTLAQQQPVTKQELKTEAADTMEKAKAYAERQKQVYANKAQAALDDLSKKIDQLKEQAKVAKGEALTKIQAALADLKVKQDQAKQKLQELGSSTGAAWEQVKTGVDKAVADLQKAYNKVSSYFK
jgi:vancomycin resistance protein YoaR